MNNRQNNRDDRREKLMAASNVSTEISIIAGAVMLISFTIGLICNITIDVADRREINKRLKKQQNNNK